MKFWPVASRFLSMVIPFFAYFQGASQDLDAQNLIRQIKEELEKNKGTFAVAFKDASSGEQVLINERESFMRRVP